MADLLRAVTIDPVRGAPIVRLDLGSLGVTGGGMATLQGTLNLGGVTPQLQTASAGRPRRAPRAVGRTDQARQMSGTWRVRGTTYADAVARVEDLLAAVGDGTDGTFLEHAPWGHATPAYHRLVGPGQWTSNYNARQFNQVLGWEFSLSWPVEIDAYGLPWDIYDDWTVTTLDEWDLITNTGVFTIDGPGAAGPNQSGTVLMIHKGRNAGKRAVDEVIVDFVWDADYTSIEAVIGRDDTTGDYLAARWVSGGTLSVLPFTSGSYGSALATQALTAPVVGDRYSLRLNKTRTQVTADVWNDGLPNPQGQTSAQRGSSATVKLSLTDSVKYRGRPGIRTVSTAAARTLLGFYRRPFTWLLPTGKPSTVMLDGLPGTDGSPDHLLDITFQPDYIAAQQIDWVLAAFGARARLQNLFWNGAFDSGLGNAAGVTLTSGVGGLTASGAGSTLTKNALEVTSLNGIGRGVSFTSAGLTGGVANQQRLWREVVPGQPITMELELNGGGYAFQYELLLGHVVTFPSGGPGTDAATTSTQVLPADSDWHKNQVTWVPGVTVPGFSATLRMVAAADNSSRKLKIRNVKIFDANGDPLKVPVRGGLAPFGPLLPSGGDLFQAGPDIVAVPQEDGSASIPGAPPVLSAVGVSPQCSVSWILDPSLAPDLEFRRPMVFEAYVTLVVPSTWLSPMIRGSLWSPDAMTSVVRRQYLQPHGSTGRAIVPPTSGSRRRTYKLGMFTLPSRQGRQRFEVELGSAGGSGTGKIERVVLVPVTHRASLPTGRAPDSAYPTFLPVQATINNREVARVIRCDLSTGFVVERDWRMRSDEGSVGGEPLTAPSGDSSLLVWGVQGVPDDPTSDAHSEGIPGSSDGTTFNPVYIHAAITPRYGVAAITQT